MGGAEGVGSRGAQEFELGNQAAREGDYPRAEQAYRDADQKGHGTAAAYAGLFAESRGELSEAEEAYQRADERGDGFGAFRLGLLLSGRSDWDGARAAWERADERGQQKPAFGLAALRGEQPDGVAPVAEEVQRSAFANPVLIGAVTVLVLIIAVFLAYNANTGLPFVPTRELKVDIANGADLVPGNDVSEGGNRVGLVSSMQPIKLPSGRTGAQLTLQLSESYADVPVDSTVTIRPRSLLGLKYLDLQKGSSPRMFGDGATLPLAQTNVPVQIDDINKLFPAKARTAIQHDLVGFGDTLAARGSALNDTIAALPSLFKHVIPVASYLVDPKTELTRFFVAIKGFVQTIAPVAKQNEELFANQATTFQAISSSAPDLESTIRESPPTLDVSTASLKVQQPFLVDLTTFSNDFAPATAQLRSALPNLDPALEAGIRVLPRTPAFNAKFERVLGALKSLALDPGTNMALNGLSSTVSILNPMIRYLGPYVTVCNDWNTMWTYFADHVSEQTSLGNAQRALLNFANHQTNNVGAQGALASANGYQAGDPPDSGYPADAEYYHSPSYGAAVDSQGNADCETGQRGYPLKLNHGDTKGRLLETDAHTPGNQGATWTGSAHVPKGETYTRSATSAPQLPNYAANP